MTEKIQKPHYDEIDIVKFLAIVSMIFVHTYETLAESFTSESKVGYWLEFLIEFFGGAPAAPVFMFCMGVGIICSRRSTPALLCRRGAVIFLLGILVNALEEILPIIYESPSWEDFLEWLPGLFAADVYFFFSLMFFFFALAVKSGRPKVFAVSAIVVSLVLGWILPAADLSADNMILDLITGLFVWSNEYSFFPLLSWMIFPAMGYLFGDVLIRSQDRSGLYRKTMLISGAVLILVTAAGFLLGQENSFLNALECSDEAYYCPNFISLAWGGAFVLFWLGGAYFLTNQKPVSHIPLISWASRNIMPIYCIQWLVISLAVPVLLMAENIAVVYLMCITVTAVTFGLTYVYLMTFRKKSRVTAAEG